MIEIKYYDDDGEEITVDVPSKIEVCSRCGGTGEHDCPEVAKAYIRHLDEEAVYRAECAAERRMGA